MFRRKREASDFGAEIEAHIELEVERLREQGLGEEEARTAARRAFGNVTRAQENFHESRRWCGGIISGRTFATARGCCARRRDLRSSRC